MRFVPAPGMPQAFERQVNEWNAVRVGGDIAPPKKIRDVRPEYPPIARDAGVTGVVIIEILIDAAGSVAEGRVLRSIPLLDQAALDAVKDWRFAPVMLNGEPRAAIMTVTVNFTLQ
jgi:protein TonB